ncbi:MAG TPA: hypothetical protein VGM88_12280 [Kofleriaceae bacterium]|jgi:hypothetical protein
MDENEIYYVDSGRNATVVNRTYANGYPYGLPPAPYSPFSPQAPVPAITRSPVRATRIVHEGTRAPYPPSGYPQPGYAMNPMEAAAMGGVGPYMQATPWGYQNPYAPLGGVLGGGRIKIGRIVDIAAQSLAALQGVPTAPTATGEVTTDVQNYGAFSVALANAVKSDERIRTVGSIIADLAEIFGL